MHSNYHRNDTNLDCTASAGHTLQALLRDQMCDPHCNKAPHVLKFTKYFTNGQCSFYWYFIFNSTANYKITGKEIACIPTSTVPVDAALPKCITVMCTAFVDFLQHIWSYQASSLQFWQVLYEQYVCEKRAQNLDKA